MDAVVWTQWCSEWMDEALRICREGAILQCFIDWRQLPHLMHAMQRSSWLIRGIVVWDKGNCRPQIGRYKQQTEYIVWASKGKLPLDKDIGCLPGIYNHPAPGSATRHHQTEKPVALMRDLLRIIRPGLPILDPFAGSGSTLVAAGEVGIDATGIEKTKAYYKIACDRLGLDEATGRAAAP